MLALTPLCYWHDIRLPRVTKSVTRAQPISPAECTAQDRIDPKKVT